MDNVKSTENEEFAECPACFFIQHNIDEDSEGGEYECERCGAHFDLVVEEEQVIEYITTFTATLTEDETDKQRLIKENKPCPGQIDIWGNTVGE